MRRAFASTLLLAAVLTTGAACAGEEPAPAGQQQEETLTVEVTFEGGSVEPNGERVDVAVGQPVEFVIEADEAGSLHVHSSPEEELSYGAGTTTLPALTFDQPGVVEVESHELDVVVVQLEVK